MIKNTFISIIFANMIFLITTSCTLRASIYSLTSQEDRAAKEKTAFLLEPFNIKYTDISYSAVTMTWEAPSDSVRSYKIVVIEGSESPASCENENAISITGTSISLTGLNSNVSYSYRLCSVSPEDGKVSAGVTGQFTTLRYLERLSLYPAFKSWNQYLNNDGSDIVSATGATCSAIYQGYSACLHGGVLFKAFLAAGTTCAQVKAYDQLQVFIWNCNDSVSPAYVYSSGIKKGKGLQSLISTQGFLKNRIVVEVDNTVAYVSNAEIWWDNPVEVLPLSTPGATVSLTNGASSVGKIFYVPDQRISGAYTVDSNDISIVVLPEGSLKLSGTVAPLIKAGTIATPKKNLWFEGVFDVGTGGSSIHLEWVAMSRIHMVKGSNIELVQSRDSFVSQLHHIGSFSTYNSNWLTIENAVFSNSATFPLDFSNSMIIKAMGITIIGGGTPALSGSLGYLPMGSIARNLTIANSYRNSLHIVTFNGANNRTLVHNFLSSNAGKIYQWRAGGNMYSNIMVGTSNSADDLINITGLDGVANKFTNHMVLSHANCIEAGNSFDSGITNGTCIPSIVSDATLNIGLDLDKLFVGPVGVDDSKNLSDILGIRLFDSLLDWFQFENPFRLWGRKDNITHTNIVGPCTTGGDCQVWDLRLKADSNNRAFNRTDLVTSQNQPFIAGSPCPTAVSGNKVTLFDFGSGTNTFLTNAHEILDDGLGDDDTLCESNESCVYNPNFGSYQGEGDYYSNGTCLFNDGTVSGVKMYSYPTIGI
ncbi:MAG: fibronectin type III domain-containing protein [Bdellovibrionaceae bacterium]|nr:fibronectin type III domain-containing protein [Pseudobdellovibrionaceae bacterium]